MSFALVEGQVECMPSFEQLESELLSLFDKMVEVVRRVPRLGVSALSNPVSPLDPCLKVCTFSALIPLGHDVYYGGI